MHHSLSHTKTAQKDTEHTILVKPVNRLGGVLSNGELAESIGAASAFTGDIASLPTLVLSSAPFWSNNLPPSSFFWFSYFLIVSLTVPMFSFTSSVTPLLVMLCHHSRLIRFLAPRYHCLSAHDAASVLA